MRFGSYGSGRRTIGADPKVPAQAVVTILAFLLSYFGIDLTAEVSGAIAVVVGVIGGVFAPAANTELKPAEVPPYNRGRRGFDETGYGLVELAVFLLILAIALVILFRIL